MTIHPTPSGGLAQDAKSWDTAYEWKAVALLTVAFGLVGLDRWILPPLFPAMMKDLRLNYQDLGNLVGGLGIAWGLSAICLGSLSDRFGRKKVLVPAVVLFSIGSAFTGFAGGMMGLLMIRILMGMAEGAVAPTGVATVVEASHPKRRGMTNGMFQCAFALFGLAIAPILATQLLKVTTWPFVFMLVGIPGLIVAVLIGLIIREPATVNRSAAERQAAPRASLREVFRHRNVPLGMLGLLCAMTGIFVISAIMPNYLVDFLKLSPQQMGFVTSAIGFGGFLGQFGVPTLSDALGRKPVALMAFAVAAVFLWVFIHTGVNLPVLFGLLFVASLFNFGALALIAGPLAAEAAPLGLISSVAGLIIGAGEVFGGGVAPVIAGRIAQGYGIQYTLYFALAGQLLGILVCLFLQETAPRKAARSAAESALDRYEDAHPEGIAG